MKVIRKKDLIYKNMTGQAMVRRCRLNPVFAGTG